MRWFHDRNDIMAESVYWFSGSLWKR